MSYPRRVVHVRRYPQGPRCWIAGQRVHHGAVGVALLALALRIRGRAGLALATLGVGLTAHDRHDWRIFFRPEGLPPAAALDNALTTR